MLRSFLAALVLGPMLAAPATAALQLYPIDNIADLPQIDDGTGPLKFDFKPFKIAKRYDGMTCKFALYRIDKQEPQQLGGGLFAVAGGHLSFSDTEWATGGLATPDSFNRANLAFTEKGELVGMLPVFNLFVGAGMVPPDAVMVTLKTKGGKLGKDMPDGTVNMDIERGMRGQFAVNGCNPPGVTGPILPYFDFSTVKLADNYDGRHCDFAMQRIDGGQTQELGHGHVAIRKGGHLVFLDGMWETNGSPQSYREINLALTTTPSIAGLMDFYGLFPDDHSSDPAPFPIKLKGEGTFDKLSLAGDVRFPLYEGAKGVLALTSCY